MPIHKKYSADFFEHGIYHVYNRTNNRELLFLSDENRYSFLEKYMKILSPFLNTYSWCLLPNHFHSLVRIKAITSIREALQIQPFQDLTLTEKKFIDERTDLSTLLEQTFKRFFQSYSLSFNNLHERKGNLFYRPFKRVEVAEDSHFTQSVLYIHANPVKHQLVEDFRDYPWSSWNSLAGDGPTELLRNELWNWFGGKPRFISIHEEMIKYQYTGEVVLE
jgi:putative transposase